MKLRGNWKKWIVRLFVFAMLVKCVVGYPKYEVKADDYSGNDCVKWVKDRAAAKLGITLPGTGVNKYNLYGANNYWYTLNYSKGSEPRANSLAIWEFNNGSDGYGGRCGHVAFVESVNGDNVTVTEGGCDGNSYAGNKGVICRTQNKSQMATLGGCSGFLGYVYLAGFGDTNGPLYSDFHVGELWAEGFTVMAKVTDSSGISSVRYAIWTENGGQDDIKWYDGTCTDGNDYYWSRINFSNHKNEKGKYIIHMYAYDTAGNLTNPGIEYDFSSNGPLYSDFHVGELWEGGFTVMAKVTSVNGVKSVRYAVWTEDGGQDDIKWYNGTCTDGNDYYWVRINFSDHKNEKGKYIIHMYAYDTADKLTNPGIEYDFSSNGPLYSDFHVGELWEGGFTVMAKVTSVNGVKSVRYAIWTEDGGQDDIKWYNGTCTDGNDYYWVRINFSDHKNEKGKYIIHMYAYDTAGKLTNPGIKYDFNSDVSGESEDVLQIEDWGLVGYNGDGGDVVIPEGVTSIENNAFLVLSDSQKRDVFSIDVPILQYFCHLVL